MLSEMKKITEEKKRERRYNTKPASEATRKARLERESRGEFPAEFMRLSLTDDAFEIVKGMDNPTFREFVSTAIRKAAKRQ